MSDDIAATSASSGRARVADRIGIIPRLLVSSVLALLITVSAVLFWTLRSVEAEDIRQSEDALRVDMSVLRHELAPLGTTWSIAPDGQLMLGDTRLTGRNDLVDAVRNVTGAVATIFLGDVRIATNVKNPDGSRGIGTKLAPGPAHDAVFRDGRSFTGRVVILGAPYLAIYEPIRDAGAHTIGILFVGESVADVQTFMHDITVKAAIGALAIGLLIGIVYLWILHATMRPMATLSRVMDRIAEGALDQAVPFGRRIDQIGRMARALARLRDTSARARDLDMAAAAARTRAEAEKCTALNGMADRVEAEATTAQHDVGARIAAMIETADEMSASAERTGQSARSAATASGQALANARAVAGAAERLNVAIREIGAQVTESSGIVRQAVAAAAETRTTIDVLNGDVARIAAVADIIGEIAAKTNLLALNATIEAARAGDAGKGFAVVATEVKALATQTASSTKEIAQHIAQVSSATCASVGAVARIERTIADINAIAGAIAAAVEEQSAATADIARNVNETAAAATAMVERIAEVSGEVEETGRRATGVHGSATGVMSAVGELGHSVIRVVRASTAVVGG